MYQYEQVDIFKRVMDANNEERVRNILRTGERRVPEQLANNLLENISSNFMFPRPKKDVFARRNFFPKTGVQEKILYKKPPFTLRNVLKYHGAGYGGQTQVVVQPPVPQIQSTNRVIGVPQGVPQYQPNGQFQPQVYGQAARASHNAQFAQPVQVVQAPASTVSLKQLYDAGQTQGIQVVRRPDGRTSYVRTGTPTAQAYVAPTAVGGFTSASAAVAGVPQRESGQARTSYTVRSASAQPSTQSRVQSTVQTTVQSSNVVRR